MMIQTTGDSPKFTIDCVLVNGSTQLEADGCVLECVEGGHKLTAPDHLRVGDTVNVQLWVEGEDTFIDIRLAIVTRVHKHWITVEVIRVSPNDRMRLKRSTPSVEKPAHIDHLLIRA
jgi:hypothetical protein